MKPDHSTLYGRSLSSPAVLRIVFRKSSWSPTRNVVPAGIDVGTVGGVVVPDFDAVPAAPAEGVAFDPQPASNAAAATSATPPTGTGQRDRRRRGRTSDDMGNLSAGASKRRCNRGDTPRRRRTLVTRRRHEGVSRAAAMRPYSARRRARASSRPRHRSPNGCGPGAARCSCRASCGTKHDQSSHISCISIDLLEFRRENPCSVASFRLESRQIRAVRACSVTRRTIRSQYSGG